MNIKEHFSDKEIERLNKLTKTIKIFKWFSILMTILLVVFSILNFYLAVIIGHRLGIYGVMNILSIWYKDIEAGKTYQWYEAVIAQRVATAHLQFVSAVILLIFYFSVQKTNNLLLKCWKLLSSEK